MLNNAYAHYSLPYIVVCTQVKLDFISSCKSDYFLDPNTQKITLLRSNRIYSAKDGIFSARVVEPLVEPRGNSIHWIASTTEQDRDILVTAITPSSSILLCCCYTFSLSNFSLTKNLFHRTLKKLYAKFSQYLFFLISHIYLQPVCVTKKISHFYKLKQSMINF